MFDVSDKIAAFINSYCCGKKIFSSKLYKKVKHSLRSSQYFTFLYNLLEKNIWCCLQIYKIYFCNVRLVRVKIFLSTFRRIYQALNGFTILLSKLPHRPLQNNKKGL